MTLRQIIRPLRGNVARLVAKKPMVAPSTHAAFTLIAENHLVPRFGEMRIGAISEGDVQAYILKLHEHGRLDGAGGVSVKTIHDIVLVFRLAMELPEFDIKSLSEILGHKNVSFTLNVYGRANLQQKTRCMNLLNDLL